MPRIEDIAFAKLVSGGKVYRNTCLVSREAVDGRWWRKDGGAFSPEDFSDVMARGPDTIILGTGFMNKVKVPDDTLELFRNAGVTCEVLDSTEAAERFNALLDAGGNVTGAFHLL